MLFQFLETHRRMLYLPSCVSHYCPSSLSCTQTDHTSAHCFPESFTRFRSLESVGEPQTALNLSETLMPGGFEYPPSDPQRQDSAAFNLSTQSLSTWFNHLGRSEFAYLIMENISVGFNWPQWCAKQYIFNWSVGVFIDWLFRNLMSI